MYNVGDVVTLLIDKSEGAGPSSLEVRAGITGMIVNAGRACGSSYAYIVDFGPEGQWNCRHNELQSLSLNIDNIDDQEHYEEEEAGWDEDDDEEIEEDITEEEAARVYADESLRPGAEPTVDDGWTIQYDEIVPPEVPKKRISFEEDLARMEKEISRGIK